MNARAPVVHRDTCRLCDSRRLELVLPIRPSAIGDAFVSDAQRGEPQGIYPLDTFLCLDCGHLQNLDIVDPEILFRNYTYRTSVSLGLVEHFRLYAAQIVARLGVGPDALVVEIGSNDGSLLKAFAAQGMRVVGIDPARDIAMKATADGVPTIPEFFSPALAVQIKATQGPAAAVCANNVFAHIDDLASVAEGIRTLLAPDGCFVFEVSYVLDMVDHLVFDTIYHEHLSHHALLPLERFLNRHDMTLFDVDRVGSKGGSIRALAQLKSTGTRAPGATLHVMMAVEERRGIGNPTLYRDLFRRIEERKHAIVDYLDRARDDGKTVAGYGASTTTTTLLYHFELGSRLGFIVDDNPLKQGLFSPGYHLPVLPSSTLLERPPDIVVILAWLYADPIIARNRSYLDAGGKFLVPLPEMRVVSDA